MSDTWYKLPPMLGTSLRYMVHGACAGVLAAACGSGARGGGAIEPETESALATQLREAIVPLYEAEVLHGGMVIALIDPAVTTGTEYISFGKAGADGEPPGADAIFEIGSVSKVLTSLLLADEAARGGVALDTPVQELLPFGVRFPDADGVRPTLAQLASHRAGLPPLPDNLAPADIADPYAGYGVQQLYSYLDRAQLLFVPGTAYAYSNLGAGILGHVLARSAGKPYEQLVAERILAPLGLEETWVSVPSNVKDRMVSGTTAGGQPTPGWTWDVLAGAGAWKSTPRDMVKLVEAAAGAAADKPVPLAAELRTTEAPIADAGGGTRVALGWHVTDGGVVWHNGMTGGYSSFLGFDPATGRGVVVLASTATPLSTRIGIGVFDLFAGKRLELDMKLAELTDDEMNRVAGRYRLAQGEELEITRDGRVLSLRMGPESVRLFPRSATEFVMLEIEASLELVLRGGEVLGFVLHLPQGQVEAERIVDPPASVPAPEVPK